MLDIFLNTRPARRCDGATRRDFLRVGGLGALGLGTLLRAEAAAGTPRGAARARSVVLVFLGGGISHHDSFDLKPDAPDDVRGKYKPIPTVVPGLQVGEKLPLMARVMNRVALVRSGAHNNDHHETATNWVLSGRFGTPFGDYPAVGAVVAHESGFSGTLPPYVAVPRNPSFTWELGKSAFLGGRYESFKAGDPNAANYKVQDLAAEPLSPRQVERRDTLLKAVDGLAKRVEGNDQVATYDEFGRSPMENEDRGTHHGLATTHFVLGGRVKGGLLGEAPRFERMYPIGGPAPALDTRRLWTTVIERWWETDASGVFTRRHAPLDLVRS